MIKNFLVIAFRNLHRQFTYSVINIVGLAIGLACSAVIFMYVFGEWSYDRHYTHAGRIYKVGVAFFGMGSFAIGPEALGESLPRQYAGVQAFTRVSKEASLIISTETQEFRELAYFTDSSFFKIFPRKFASGSPLRALQHDHSMVITMGMAQKIFGTTDVLGKTLLVDKEKKPFVVTGIVADDMRPSQFEAKIWLSNHSKLTGETLYTSANMYNYVLLKAGQTQADLEAGLDRILEKEVYPHPMGVPDGISFAEYKMHPNAVQFPVLPLLDVHLKSTLRYEISPGGNENNMYVFGAISLFVLLLASVNFINLTTARASRRAREVGIRKAVGSSRSRLIAQFLSESLMVTGIAMVLALFFGEALLLVFQLMSGTKLIQTLWTPWNLSILLIFTLIIGVCSGLYPAFYLTAFKPVRVLKGNLAMSGGNSFRNVLVVAQFTISLCLMMCTAIIISQMNYMKNRDLGFDGQNVMTIDNLQELDTHVEVFERFLSGLPGVTNVALHSGEPGNESMKMVQGFKSKVMSEPISLNTYPMDERMIPLMDFKIVTGRNFNKDLPSDTAAVILNEAAVKALGLTDPVDAELDQGLRVIGVVKDYHWQSLREKIGPSVFVMGRGRYTQLSMSLSSGAASDIIEKATEKWKSLASDEPMTYHFVDENFMALLERERLFERAVGFFTVLAIFISCLGLYGLSAYTTEQRNKEIGIRKVMGASATHIVVMLNKRFAVLVSISVTMATPIAAYFMMKWLEGFAYRVDMEAGSFVVAISTAFVVALLTVSYHSIKASLTNPVDALKYE